MEFSSFCLGFFKEEVFIRDSLGRGAIFIFWAYEKCLAQENNMKEMLAMDVYENN